MGPTARVITTILTICFLIYWHPQVEGSTRRVPLQYPTIQSAINAAASNDTILVAPGLYDDNLNTGTKYLSLLSEAGAAATVIDGGGRARVVLMSGGGVIDGFTLRGGRDDSGAGVRIEGGVTTIIRNNIIRDNIAGSFDLGFGGGLYVGDPFNSGDFQILNNTFTNNSAGDEGGGLYNTSPNPTGEIRGNTFTGNSCHVCGGGARVGATRFIQNLVLRNWADSFGGGICAEGSEVHNNTVVENFTNNVFVQGAGIVVSARSRVTHNVVVSNHGLPGQATGAGIVCAGSEPQIVCNDSWNNDGGDYAPRGGCAIGPGSANISADPSFCDPSAENYHISASSPCAPAQNPDCGLIGAFGIGCAATPTRPTSWGSLKLRYR